MMHGNSAIFSCLNIVTLQIHRTLGTDALFAWSLQGSRKDGATQRDGARERCVVMVKDKALQYNADIQ